MTFFDPNPIGKVIIELRDDGDVHDLVDERVSGQEPAPGWADYDESTGYAHAFIVVSILAGPPEPRLPVWRPRLSVACYGRSHQEAMAVSAAARAALHNAGPRVHGNGLGIYNSFDDTGPEAEKDPDTGQPRAIFVMDLIATTLAVA